MQSLIVNPEHFARLTKGLREQFEKRLRAESPELGDAQKKLNDLLAQIDRAVSLAMATEQPVKQLAEKIDALERERANMAERVRLLQAERNVLSLHPRALDAYLENIKQLLPTLVIGEGSPEARAALHMLLDSIVVHRTAKRMPYEITAYGRISGTLGTDLAPPVRSAKEVLEEAGVFNADNAGLVKPMAAISEHISEQVICLGRWAA